MIDLQITCAPCLAVFASTYVIYSPCQLPCPELIPRCTHARLDCHNQTVSARCWSRSPRSKPAR